MQRIRTQIEKQREEEREGYIRKFRNEMEQNKIDCLKPRLTLDHQTLPFQTALRKIEAYPSTLSGRQSHLENYFSKTRIDHCANLNQTQAIEYINSRMDRISYRYSDVTKRNNKECKSKSPDIIWPSNRSEVLKFGLSKNHKAGCRSSSTESVLKRIIEDRTHVGHMTSRNRLKTSRLIEIHSKLNLAREESERKSNSRKPNPTYNLRNPLKYNALESSKKWEMRDTTVLKHNTFSPLIQSNIISIIIS